jgi:hypothetical protein
MKGVIHDPTDTMDSKTIIIKFIVEDCIQDCPFCHCDSIEGSKEHFAWYCGRLASGPVPSAIIHEFTTLVPKSSLPFTSPRSNCPFRG